MNILVLGGGGREHALAAKIAGSKLCNKLVVAPGNPGIAKIAQVAKIETSEFEKISDLIKEEQIDTLIVGPEQPLVDGVSDFLEDLHPDLLIIGPKKYGAQLEGSKAFAKEFMVRNNIPTATYFECTTSNIEEGLLHLENTKSPYVLKADGLAAGKGVLILDDLEEAKNELANMLGGKFGSASNKVVIEQFLDGIEFSVFVLTDGFDYVLLPEAKDYKRIGEGDKGLNTGGMGAVSPVPFFKGDIKIKVLNDIIEPTVKGLAKDGIPYVGFIFFGLILVENEPFVIEYNCRLGDPETEAILPRMNTDLLELCQAIKNGKLNEVTLDVIEETAVTIILVSGGYPEDFQKGYEITGLDLVQNSLIYHSGTKEVDNKIVNNGGRVIAVTSLDKNLQGALSTSKENAKIISWEGKYFRSDIGFDL